MQKLPRANSVMELHLRETPRIQERMKIETTMKCHYFMVEIQLEIHMVLSKLKSSIFSPSKKWGGGGLKPPSPSPSAVPVGKSN